MGSTFRYANSELARRCLHVADATHVNYWGPAVPLALLVGVGSFVAAIDLADPRAHHLPVLLTTYLAYLGLNASRLAAGTPAETAPAGPSPLIRYWIRAIAAVLPLLLEALVFVPLLRSLAPGYDAMDSLMFTLTLLVGLPTLLGLFWVARQHGPRPAFMLTILSAVLIGGILRVGLPIIPAWLDRTLGPWACGMLALCFIATVLISDTVGRMDPLDAAPMPAPSLDNLPDGFSLPFLWHCVYQAMSWGTRPWPRWIRAERLRECWYAIGLYVTLVLGLVFCTRLAMVSVRNHAELTQCEANERNIVTALQMYSDDHEGHYPPSLQALVPTYLPAIPTCPTAGLDTYSNTYETSTHPDRYVFFCRGTGHVAAGGLPDHPRREAAHALDNGLPGRSAR